MDNIRIILSNIIFATFLVAVVVFTPYVIYKNHFAQEAIEGYSSIANTLGLLAATLGGIVVVTNLYLSFIRPWVYLKRNSDMQGYKNVSGIPMVGSIFILVASFLLAPSKLIGIVILVLFLLDTGGLPCFLLMMAIEFVRNRTNA